MTISNLEMKVFMLSYGFKEIKSPLWQSGMTASRRSLKPRDPITTKHRKQSAQTASEPNFKLSKPTSHDPLPPTMSHIPNVPYAPPPNNATSWGPSDQVFNVFKPAHGCKA